MCGAVNGSLVTPGSPFLSFIHLVSRGHHLLSLLGLWGGSHLLSCAAGTSGWMSLTNEKFQKPDGVSALIFSVLLNQ